jgi:hypothetical protein
MTQHKLMTRRQHKYQRYDGHMYEYLGKTRPPVPIWIDSLGQNQVLNGG